jgi:polysaccharide deacetylase 2 family uncharacterized protein YibQ
MLVAGLLALAVAAAGLWLHFGVPPGGPNAVAYIDLTTEGGGHGAEAVPDGTGHGIAPTEPTAHGTGETAPAEAAPEKPEPAGAEHAAAGHTAAEPASPAPEAPAAPAAEPAAEAPAAPPAAEHGGGEAQTAATPPADGAARTAPPAGETAAQAPSPVPAPAVALAPAPDPALVERGPNGQLPIIARDGRTSFEVYARPFDDKTNRPRIALVVAGLGLRQTVTRKAIADLPPEVSLAFTPYARGLADWIAEARGDGHEVLLQIPMEPIDYPANDPGPQTLLTSLTPVDNGKRLDWVLGRATGYVGLVTLMGSKFTADAAALTPIVETLKTRGLMLVDSRTAPRSVVVPLATKAGLPRAAVTVQIDSRPVRASIDQRLAELERAAVANGFAVGLAAEGVPIAYDAIAAWAATLGERGLVLAPVSAVAGRQSAE